MDLARTLALFIAVGGAISCTTEADDVAPQERLACGAENGRALYDKRIAPLLADERPSSCNECHLSGLDLGSFVRGTPCQTMACMAEKGIVDLSDPEQSLVLAWIDRANPSSELITAEVIDEEYEAMLQWIEFSSRCDECGVIRNPCGEEPGFEQCEIPWEGVDESNFEDPGDCSYRTLEAMFAEKVYAWRGRCFPCHFPSQAFDAPKWLHTGPCEIGAASTMRELLDSGLVDIDNPRESLLLTKPLAEGNGGVHHEGHDKITGPEEPIYRDYVEWLERFAACAR